MLVARLQTQRAAAAARGLQTAELDRQLRNARDDLQVTEAFRDRGMLEIDPGEEQATIAPWLKGPVEKVAKNPDLLFYKLKTNAYKFSWMLIPLSVPFMWLLFPLSRRYRLYDHTVFVTYSLTFLSMAAILLTFLKLLGLNGPAALLPLIIPLAHLFRQLRGAYGLSVWSALWRTFALAALACVAAALFFLMLLALGVLG